MTGTNPPGHLSPFAQHQTILAKNTGSSEIPIFGLCEWTGWAIDTELGLHLTVKKLGTTNLTRLAVNQLQPIAASGFGAVSMIGDFPTLIQIDTGTPAIGEVWGPKDSSFGIERNFKGLWVIGSQQTVANVSATLCVRYPKDLIFKAKADANVTAGGTGTFSIWVGGSDSGVNVTATLDWAEGGTDVSLGKEVYVRYFPDEDKWYWFGGECE